MADAFVALRDGRMLAYTELGSSSGPLVMYFHGGPGSRLDLAIFRDDFTARGLRVVSADRPGYGRSSPQPGRCREDWPADVATLADHLGVDRFSVLGLSSGGPYAVACAALSPDRVSAAGVVGGETDFAWSGAWDGYPEDEGEAMRIGDLTETADWCAARYGADGSRFMEGDLLGELPAADQAALADERFATGLATTITEAFRQGVAGYAQDMVIQGQPWTFEPSAVVAPVWIHHGEADSLTPPAHAHHTAGLVPTARLVTWPGHGHVSLITRISEIASGLVAASR